MPDADARVELILYRQRKLLSVSQFSVSSFTSVSGDGQLPSVILKSEESGLIVVWYDTPIDDTYDVSKMRLLTLIVLFISFNFGTLGSRLL